LGNGDGTFPTGVRYPLTKGATAVAIADFNGDGKAGLAVLSEDGVNMAGYLTAFLGNGDGTFRNALTYGAGAEPSAFAVGDDP
jgi:hypothetical protein